MSSQLIPSSFVVTWCEFLSHTRTALPEQARPKEIHQYLQHETLLYVVYLFSAELRWPEGPPSGAPYPCRKLKETHELIFSWLSWLAVLLAGAYARRRRRRRWSRARWRSSSKLGSFRLDYEYDFSIVVFRLHIIMSHTHFIIYSLYLKPTRRTRALETSLVWNSKIVLVLRSPCRTQSRTRSPIWRSLIGWQGHEALVYRVLLCHWTFMLWSIDTCQNKVYLLTVSRDHIADSSLQLIEVMCFFEDDR